VPTLRKISIDDLDHFQLDENNQLYWDGKKVRTEITLPLKMDWAVWIIAVSTLIGAVYTILYWG
jgi:hypothetical protein